MTIEQIMKLTPGQRAKLSKSELAKLTGQLTSAANKRLKRLEEAGIAPASNAYNFIVKHSGGKFSTAGLDIQGLDIEFQRAAKFLQQQTSTIKGTRAAIDKREKATAKWLKENLNITDYETWSKAKKERFWDLFNSSEAQHAIEQHFQAYKATGEQKTLEPLFLTRDLIKIEEEQYKAFGQNLLQQLPGKDNAKERARIRKEYREALRGESLDYFEQAARESYEERALKEAQEADEMTALFDWLFGMGDMTV